MNKRLAFFILALAVQVAILAAVPGKQVYARLTGKLITIKTTPVDPYDFLSGYHVVLNYEISRLPELEPTMRTGTDQEIKGYVYVILKAGDDGIWSATSVHNTWPKNVPDGCLVIKGHRNWRGIRYGIESYFIPEKHREAIEKDLRQNQRQAKAQIKVDRFGNSALIRLLVEDRIYEY
ncbi:MAG TPA: GDYXXLXY domain-containing protein [Planctomycetes bacterium]|nr:GDYXXLXY domain-containing protein [Planctomycetota bacterium]